MKWTDEQLAKFRADEYICEDSIYADSIMRPMAEVLCPEVLRHHDRECNDSDDPLGPNWHTFACDLEAAIKAAHQIGDNDTIRRFYTFLNWALFEKTSYLHKETIVSPFEGIIEIQTSKWLKYIPMPIIDKMIPFMAFYMSPDISAGMRFEKNLLLDDPVFHELHWKPCHEKFTEIALRKGIPYTNLL